MCQPNQEVVEDVVQPPNQHEALEEETNEHTPLVFLERKSLTGEKYHCFLHVFFINLLDAK